MAQSQGHGSCYSDHKTYSTVTCSEVLPTLVFEGCFCDISCYTLLFKRFLNHDSPLINFEIV